MNLTSLSAPDSDDVVAAGYYFVHPFFTRPFVENWDGNRWTNMNVPALGGISANNGLTGVSAVRPDDIWAVGVLSPHADARGLIDHWDGTGWSTSRFTIPGYRNIDVSGVSFADPKDGWIAGTAYVRKTVLFFAAQWTRDGWRVWKLMKTTDQGPGVLTGVSTVSLRRAYAVGYLDPQHAQPLLFTWNGHKWTQSRHLPQESP